LSCGDASERSEYHFGYALQGKDKSSANAKRCMSRECGQIPLVIILHLHLDTKRDLLHIALATGTSRVFPRPRKGGKQDRASSDMIAMTTKSLIRVKPRCSRLTWPENLLSIISLSAMQADNTNAQ
jgi:hypothetical protein